MHQHMWADPSSTNTVALTWDLSTSEGYNKPIYYNLLHMIIYQ